MGTLTQAQAAWLKYYWHFWARPEQIAPPGEGWRIWLILAGRGWGKTRVGAEWVREKAETHPGCIIHLVGRTAADVRDVMVTGESGILACSPPWHRPTYHPSLRMITWPNGSIARCFSAEKPASLRGPQCHYMWLDEWAAWQYPDDAFNMANLGLRLGRYPQAAITTTPRILEFLRKLIHRKNVKVADGDLSSYANRENLPAAFLEELTLEYEGTTLGLQEVYAKLLQDARGALWKREAMIAKWRVFAGIEGKPEPPSHFARVAVGVDPPASSTGAECGIIASGKAALAGKDHGFVLEDASIRGDPEIWATAAVDCYFRQDADIMVGETNQGGDMVRHAIRTIPANDWRPGGDRVRFQPIHASKGKQARANLLVPYYEQGRIHHVGYHTLLEDQMCQWEPDAGLPSPDRLDALVWSIWPLLIEGKDKRSYGW